MSGADRDTIIENIDIGGPSMVRSAAKNHAHVAIVTDPADYAELLAELDANGGSTSLEFRKQLAAKAFALTAAYDSTISQWFAFADQGERWPADAGRCASTLKMPLRYGENPHQQAALYVPVGPHARGIAQAEQVQGKELSYNNLNDANAALELVAEFRDGAADRRHRQARQPVRRRQRATRLLDAWNEALACDSVSAFGGIVATNRPLDAATAEAITADLHRSRRRARCRRGRAGDLRQEEEPAPAADRRASRSGARRPDHCGHRRRPPGPGPRQWHRSRATSSNA